MAVLIFFLTYKLEFSCSKEKIKNGWINVGIEENEGDIWSDESVVWASCGGRRRERGF